MEGGKWGLWSTFVATCLVCVCVCVRAIASRFAPPPPAFFFPFLDERRKPNPNSRYTRGFSRARPCADYPKGPWAVIQPFLQYRNVFSW